MELKALLIGALLQKETSISIIIYPTIPGTYSIEIRIIPSEGDLITMTNTVDVQIPDEGTTSLIVPQYIVAESSVLFIQGLILHQSTDSCYAHMSIPEEGFYPLNHIYSQSKMMEPSPNLFRN